MSLYKVRLFRLMKEENETNFYEVYCVGKIIVSKGIMNCKEYLYGNEIPVIDRKKKYEIGEPVGGYNMHLSSKNAKSGYVVFKEDLNEKNKLTKKDLVDFRPDEYAKMAMHLLKAEKTPLKKLFKTKNGVVYGRDVRRS